MTIFDFNAQYHLTQLTAAEATDLTPYGMLLGLGACSVYTDHRDIWVVIENEGPLFRLRCDTLSYGGRKDEQDPTLESFGKAGEATGH